MNLKDLSLLVAIAATFISPLAWAAEMEEVIVTAGFRDTSLDTTPASISVLDKNVIRQRSAVHVQDVLNVAPNVNYAGGTSTARFIQVRGTGERSQFVDPIDPSVGLVIDDIDMSGIGAAASMFDVERVEVLRGPQGTQYGASALAGLINITSAAPGDETSGFVDAMYGNYNTWSLGAAVGGPLANKDFQGRVAVQKYSSDGYTENTFLDREDTANRDELTARGRLDWQLGEDHAFSTTLLYADIDNGYDAFSLDNTRETLSDEPGHDRQKTTAAAFKYSWDGSNVFAIEAIASGDITGTEYGFDEDWSYDGLCTGTPCEGWEYSSTDNYIRDRKSARLELRFLSRDDGELFGNTPWVTGVYAYQRDEDLKREFYDFDLDIANAEFTSDYDTRRFAVYGETLSRLSDRLSMTVGLRFERFNGDYGDSVGVASKPSENLWGGELALDYLVTDSTMLYGLVTRGYKAGGVNGEALGKAIKNDFAPGVVGFLSNRLEFDSETLVNYEIGVKGNYFDQRLAVRVALFYMDRKDVQIKGWYNEGPLFVGYVDNAASGKNQGAELETVYTFNDHINVFANIGLLRTEINDYEILGDAGLEEQSGRDQAHAPYYQFNLGTAFNFGPGLYGRLEVEGKDEFYFSDSHDQKSDKYTLLHARIGWEINGFDIALWGRNLTDQDYQVRGFYFGNDPRTFYEDTAYYQFGEPRTVGVQMRYSF